MGDQISPHIHIKKDNFIKSKTLERLSSIKMNWFFNELRFRYWLKYQDENINFMAHTYGEKAQPPERSTGFSKVRGVTLEDKVSYHNRQQLRLWSYTPMNTKSWCFLNHNRYFSNNSCDNLLFPLKRLSLQISQIPYLYSIVNGKIKERFYPLLEIEERSSKMTFTFHTTQMETERKEVRVPLTILVVQINL